MIFFNQIILSFTRPISKENEIDQREITQYLNRTFNVYFQLIQYIYIHEWYPQPSRIIRVRLSDTSIIHIEYIYKYGLS